MEVKMSKPEITVTKRQLSIWLLRSFRYCLGRHTYVVSDCADDLKKYWEVMPEGYRKQIVDDIKHYLEHLLEGEHICDIKTWTKLLAFAEKNLEAPSDK